MTAIYNFSAGPAVLPQDVLKQAQEELPNWHGSGMSVMEMSHRGKEFMGIIERAEADLRELMNIPANYKVLFLQGGATAQFSAIPMNLLRGKTTADYVYTGEWAKKAIKEAKRYCTVNIVASSEDKNFMYAPPQSQWKLNPDAAYVHYTSNETIQGVEFNWVPETNGVPLVADMSSHILSRPIDITKYALIYAGAQKNIGPAGLTIVIVREDLLGNTLPFTPMLFDYKVEADNASMMNTPPTYAIYMAGLVFAWLKKLGGIAKMEEINIAKSKLLYDYIDSTDFYQSPVNKPDRSRMNVPFTLAKADLDEEFLKQAKAAGLLQLKGHRSVGGMRASIYNAMPIDGVKSLVAFMTDFETKNK
ncbi:MAG: 3-phosphoserine/phosphohydroxythreonine aminotransferase [Deltaproteobacteria bacterium CG11_big_fil_rev_8_21_14_0_20_47_16]|nr:MAG: 3-phosphoserine/phosphohydroxythreonine aminotransferase [Deltaproteobacteria bacterium CG11_big_fil_rev_8_21_14_0_20_47_16]